MIAMHIVGCLGMVEGVACTCEEIKARAARERREAERVVIADGIVREVAETSPFYDHNGCAYCVHRVHSDGSDPHADNCLWLRARQYAEEK
jgi:hypothetical protein